MLERAWLTPQPTALAVEGEATEAGGVTEGWFTLRDRRGARQRPRAAERRQGLDAADDDDRAEGLRGAQGPQRATRASSTACTRAARPGSSERAGGGRAGLHHAALRRDRRRRAGRHRARRAAEAAGRADDHRREERAARRLLAQALQVPVPARPGLVRPPAVPAVPRPLAGVLAQGQDRRLARDVHQGDGAQLLGLAPSAKRRATTRRSRSGRSTVERDGKRDDAAPEAAGARHRHVGLPEHAADRRAPRRSRASSTTRSAHPGPRPTAARSAW